MEKSTFNLHINGKGYTVEVDPETPLLYVLRNQIQLNGPKYGCGQGQCGSCMVIMDRRVGISCMVPVRLAVGREIITLAGLKGKDGGLHPVQQAFLDQQAAQCGYCTNGMIVSAVALLNKTATPTDADITQYLQPNLCRCGTQSRVVKAIKQASDQLSQPSTS